MKHRTIAGRPFVLSLLLALAAGPLSAEVRMAAIFGNNMVLQREIAIPVWGWADPGEAVSVKFAGQQKTATAGSDGRWQVKLDALQATAKGATMVVSGKNTLQLGNVVVGDVWVCSGQSNMEWVVASSANRDAEIAAAKYPAIRHVKIGHHNQRRPVDDLALRPTWAVCSPQTVAGFTAVGYFFGRTLHQELGVPIGLIGSNWGGTRIEPWTPPEGFRRVPELKSLSARVDTWDPTIDAGNEAYGKTVVQLKEWLPVAEKALKAREPVPPFPRLPEPGLSHQEPTKLYNGMIHPIIPYAIRGAIWYQGESNGGEGISYYHKKRALIGGWRGLWGQGDFPFYFVQLANFRSVTDDPKGDDGWARIREAQTKCLEIPNTGMAVIIDIGEARDIHPRNKQDVGARLALWALAKDYGRDIVYSGPIYKQQVVEGRKIRVSFDHVGSGLMVGEKKGLEPTREVPNGQLRRFAIAGADKKWHWADAKIDGNTVLVSCEQVAKPVAVRYAFATNPEGCNLYNKEGLPASPFRTDNW